MKSYYSFVKKGIKFIVLDANFREDQKDMIQEILIGKNP